MSDQVGNPGDRFSHNEAHLIVALTVQSMRHFEMAYTEQNWSKRKENAHNFKVKISILCKRSHIWLNYKSTLVKITSKIQISSGIKAEQNKVILSFYFFRSLYNKFSVFIFRRIFSSGFSNLKIV